MFIKVTNMTAGRNGDPLIINLNSIIAVYDDHEEGGSLSTKIYGYGNLTWTVEESVHEVHDAIKAAINSVKWSSQ
jgi:hypothetical protein